MTEADLLRRVCLDPADDLPRLLYADWCDGNGDPERAEFIRLQCLLASRYPPSIDDRLHCTKPFRAGINMPSVAGVPKGTPMATCKACEVCRDMARLRQREDELLPAIGCPFPADEWMDLYDRGYPGIHWRRKDGLQCFNCVAERGFVAEVSCDCSSWLAHGPAIVQQQPITRVVLPGATSHELRQAAIRAHTPTDLPQSEMALLWARRVAGLDLPCDRCGGEGSITADDGWNCPDPCKACKGTGVKAVTA